MKLDAIIRGGAEALLYMERYVDEGAKTYSPFAAKFQVAAEYQPRSDRPSFQLVSVWVPRNQVSLFQADAPSNLWDFYVRRDEVLFLVHPETWNSAEIEHLDQLRALRRGPTIGVAPTASTRTVYTTATPSGVPPHFIKLHYPRRISRFHRRLRRKNIHNSVEATRDVAQVRSERFAYLPDTLGCIYGSSDSDWGFLIRDAMPRPLVTEPRFLIPVFALYGGDFKHPDHPPLLVQLIERLGAEPQSFVIDEIMIPVLQCWAKAVRERGLLLESHAQNLLLEIDESFRPRRVVHRDFDVWIDPDARRRAGLEIPFLGAQIESDTPYPRQQHYSLIYDHFIGRELFDYLLGILTQHYSARERAVRSRVAEAFHQCFPDAAELFPTDTTFYFSNEILPGNDFHLVDTKQKPEWR
jgi:hypothetical protein